MHGRIDIEIVRIVIVPREDCMKERENKIEKQIVENDQEQKK